RDFHVTGVQTCALPISQCTDVCVNKTTPFLFAKADNPYDMIKLSVEEIADIIRPCGLSPMKSKGIYGLSKILIDQYNGEVPADKIGRASCRERGKVWLG